LSETDLGEYIVQLADERPSHIVGPALHKSQVEVGALFNELAGQQIPQEAEDLAAFARERLRTDFRRADMGITGVNFAAADTGTLTLVTNEGNADMVTSPPRIHVAVMTLEKVIPRFRDLAVLVPLLCHAATAQKLTVYLTMLNGPRRKDEADGPEQAAPCDLGQRAQLDRRGPLRGGSGVYPLRQLPDRLPCLPHRRRSRLRVGVWGADRRRLDPAA